MIDHVVSPTWQSILMQCWDRREWWWPVFCTFLPSSAIFSSSVASSWSRAWPRYPHPEQSLRCRPRWTWPWCRGSSWGTRGSHKHPCCCHLTINKDDIHYWHFTDDDHLEALHEHVSASSITELLLLISEMTHMVHCHMTWGTVVTTTLPSRVLL